MPAILRIDDSFTMTGLFLLALDILASLVVRSTLLVLRLVPTPFARLISRAIVRVSVGLVPRLRRVALRNLELIFPSLTKDERERLFRQSLNHLANNLLIFSRLDELNREWMSCHVDFSEVEKQFEWIRQRREAPGVLVLTMHFGSWELAAQAYTIWVRPLWILARGFGLTWLDKYWNSRRSMFGSVVFSRGGGFKTIIEQLRAGNDVAVLCDQNVKKNHAAWISFFGRSAATSKALAIAAQRTNCPVVFMVMAQLDDDKYRGLGCRLPNPNELPGNHDQQIDQFLELLHRQMEEVIRKHPDHWFWIHRRYKTRPPGEAETLYDGG